MTTISELNLPKQLVAKVFPTGSRVICNPTPTDTDEDFIVLLQDEDDQYDMRDWLGDDGWKDPDYNEYPPLAEIDDPEYGFSSYRKGDLNIIITASTDFFENFVMATLFAKYCNLLKKEDRIEVFKYYLYEIDTDINKFLIHENLDEFEENTWPVVNKIVHDKGNWYE